MKENTKKLISGLILGTVSVLFGALIANAVILQGYQGGTGYGAASSTQNGDCIQISSTTPFLTYTFGPCGSGSSETTTINGTQATSFTLKGDGTTITSSVSGATTTFSVPANTYYPYSSNPSSYIKHTDLSAGGTGLTYNNSTGAFTWTNPGYITGNQTITLTGPVTGSGATSIATTIVSPLTVNVSTTAVTSTNIAAQTLTANQTSTFNGIIHSKGYSANSNNIYGDVSTFGLELSATDATSDPYLYLADATDGGYANLVAPLGHFLFSAPSGQVEIVGNNSSGWAADLSTTNLTTNRSFQFPNAAGTFSLTNIDNNFSTGQTISGNLTSTNATFNSGLKLPFITNHFLATDASGNVIATTTPSSGGGAATSTFPWTIEYPNTSEIDQAWDAPATTTIKGCTARNKGASDTVKWGLAIATSGQSLTATTSMMEVFTSENTTNNTSTWYAANGSTTVPYLDELIWWTDSTTASSTQFHMTCEVSL